MEEDTTSNRYALIQIAKEGYAIPLRDVLELVDHPEYETWIGKGEVVGFFKYAKKRIPVYLLGRLLNLDAASEFLILIKGDNSPFGLLVPERPALIEFQQQNILPLPDLLPEKGKKILTGVITFDNKIYGLLDPRRLIG